MNKIHTSHSFPSKGTLLLEDLEALLSKVPPEQLRKTIHRILSKYLQTIDNDMDLEEFKLIASDFYFLNKFLEMAEEELKREEA